MKHFKLFAIPLGLAGIVVASALMFRMVSHYLVRHYLIMERETRGTFADVAAVRNTQALRVYALTNYISFIDSMHSLLFESPSEYQHERLVNHGRLFNIYTRSGNYDSAEFHYNEASNAFYQLRAANLEKQFLITNDIFRVSE